MTTMMVSIGSMKMDSLNILVCGVTVLLSLLSEGTFTNSGDGAGNYRNVVEVSVLWKAQGSCHTYMLKAIERLGLGCLHE